MQRLPSGKRRLIAFVVALLALSALLGDTSSGQAAEVAPAPMHALDPIGCGGNDPSSRGEATAAGMGSGSGFGPLVQRGPGASPRALAGVPPWTIWPPAPLPRIGGAFVHSPAARARSTGPPLFARAVTAPESASALNAIKARASSTLPEPALPAERLGGVDLASPRPPPR